MGMEPDGFEEQGCASEAGQRNFRLEDVECLTPPQFCWELGIAPNVVGNLNIECTKREVCLGMHV